MPGVSCSAVVAALVERAGVAFRCLTLALGGIADDARVTSSEPKDWSGER